MIIRIKETKEQPTLTIRVSTTLESIPDKIGKIFSEILAFIGEKGITPAGAPFAFWHKINPTA